MTQLNHHIITPNRTQLFTAQPISPFTILRVCAANVFRKPDIERGTSGVFPYIHKHFDLLIDGRIISC